MISYPNAEAADHFVPDFGMSEQRAQYNLIKNAERGCIFVCLYASNQRMREYLCPRKLRLNNLKWMFLVIAWEMANEGSYKDVHRNDTL
jgi:hypothetical protein